ncbi:MAG: YicC family protein [Rhodospirillales bacterium]|nr:YicC family protein [Rhodospirillales bacterium]
MTGFARAQGGSEDRAWTWEVRSVNSRGLDVRCRYPSGRDSIEIAARERVAKRFKRGSVTMNLTMVRSADQSNVRINHALLDQLIELTSDLQRRLVDFRVPSADGLLAIRGVVEVAEEEMSEEARAALDTALLATLEEALDGLERARREEGARLAPVLAGQIDRITDRCNDAAQSSAAQPAAILARLKEQVSVLADTLPEDRLIQEAALLATKADPTEEIDRIRAHCTAARQLLEESAPSGRRLDFLCQELNREANTLCSKAADLELTRVGLDLKAIVEQLREQVQNIE